MGNITKSAILEFMDMDAELEAAAERDAELKNRYNLKRNWAVCDEHGEVLAKVPNQAEAVLTRAEFRKIDEEETGKKKKYIIKQLD